jgi:hypothetical protein
MHSSGPTSLLHGQNRRSAIHAGDVVVYEESNGPENKVLAAFMGFKVELSNSGSAASSALNMQIYARRLYGPQELFASSTVCNHTQSQTSGF